MQSTKHILLPHSKAKIELYINYLSVYLNILKRVDFIEKIYIYDLFAGEGIYSDGEKGSSILTIEAIKNHFFSNNKKCKDIDILFNDYGNSEIEKDKLKIERIKENVDKIFKPTNVRVSYSNIDYSLLIPELLLKLNSLKNSERVLLFIDPWGYKEIKPVDIKKLLENQRTELLLFLPITHMYRFADASLTHEFEGGKALEKFLKELFGGDLPDTSNTIRFIVSIKEKLKEYLAMKMIDTFYIKRDKSNIYCLFFFTNNRRGFEKMIETKWKVDKEHGKGYTENKDIELFDEITISGFDEKLKNFIFDFEGRTNIEIGDFVYENGFLPKHCSAILKKLKENDLLELHSLDDKPISGFYINDKKRKIIFRKRI